MKEYCLRLDITCGVEFHKSRAQAFEPKSSRRRGGHRELLQMNRRGRRERQRDVIPSVQQCHSSASSVVHKLLNSPNQELCASAEATPIDPNPPAPASTGLSRQRQCPCCKTPRS